MKEHGNVTCTLIQSVDIKKKCMVETQYVGLISITVKAEVETIAAKATTFTAVSYSYIASFSHKL